MAAFPPRAPEPPGLATAAVRIVEWPLHDDALDELAESGVPRLLLVEDGAEPPVGGDCCQDWMWRSGGEHELRLRLRQLSLRVMGHGHGTPHLDALGMLRVGLRSVHVPGKEQLILRVLLDNFNRSVSREAIVREAWPEGTRRHNTVANRMSSLRSRITWLGLEIIGTAGTGYRLRPSCTGLAPDAPGGFEDDLDVSCWFVS